jgi:hypothetical protein
VARGGAALKQEGKKAGRPPIRLFWWTLAVLAVLLAGLIALSVGGPDAPFTYIIQ